MYKSFFGIGLTIFLSGCGNSNDSISNNSPFNELKSKIMLKDLTTGVKLDAVKLPKIYSVGKNETNYKLEYYGQKRSVKIKHNEDGIIHTVDIDLDPFEAFELKRSLEEKYKKESDQNFTFKCDVVSEKFDSIKIDNYTCSAYYGSQTLQIINKSIEDKNVPQIVVSALTRGSLILKDGVIESEGNRKKLEKIKDNNEKKKLDI
jgi:hypothetical protein